MVYQSWTWFFFIIFLSITTFAIMNVVVAVMMKKAEMEKQAAMAKIYNVFQTADADGNGKLTRQEFMDALTWEDVTLYLHEVGIDVRQAENLFDILDYDESG